MTAYQPFSYLPSSDAELIDAARLGDVSAYDELFHRHEVVIRRLARGLERHGLADVEDLVMKVYAGGFDALRAGDGPVSAFRTYLLRAVLAYAAPGLAEVQELHEQYDRGDQPYRLAMTPEQAAAGQDLEEVDRAVAELYSGLPEEWQVVLWHSEVEHDAPEQLALLLAVTPEDAADSIRRARNVLRKFAEAQHRATTRPARCRFVIDRLGDLDSGALPDRETFRVQQHLEHCPECSLLCSQLTAIDKRLGEILVRSVLGRFTSCYIDQPVAAPQRVTFAGRLRRFSRRRRGVAAVSVAAALGVAAATWGVAAFLGDNLRTATDGSAWATVQLPDTPGPGEHSVSRTDQKVSEAEPVAKPTDSQQNRARAPQPFLPTALAEMTEPTRSPVSPVPGPVVVPSKGTPIGEPPPSTPPGRPATTPAPQPSTVTPTPTPTPTPVPEPTPTPQPTPPPTVEPTPGPTPGPTGQPTGGQSPGPMLPGAVMLPQATP